MDKINYKPIQNLLECPTCRGTISVKNEHAYCNSCETNFAFVNGILSFVHNSKTYWQTFFTDRIQKATDDTCAVGYANKRNFNLIHESITKIVGHLSDTKILDIGCGNGLMSQWLAEDNLVIGADFVIEMLNESLKRGLIPIHADATKLPLRQKVFDLVLAIEMIQHIDDHVDFINSLCELVNEGGKILITAANIYSIQRKTNRTIQNLIRAKKGKKKRPILYDPHRLAEIIQANGFKTDIYYTVFPFSWIITQTEKSKSKNHLGSNFIIIAQKNE